MSPERIIILILVIVLLIVFIIWLVKKVKKDKFGGSDPVKTDVRAPLEKQITAFRDVVFDNRETNNPAGVYDPRDLLRYKLQSPERMYEMEASMYFDKLSKEGMSTKQDKGMGTHAEAYDHDKYLKDITVGPRLREQHNQWVNEYKPLSQTSTLGGNLEPEQSMDWQGLFRPSPVPIYNPQQLPGHVSVEDVTRGSSNNDVLTRY